MKSLLTICLFIFTCLTSISGQDISIRKLMKLQKESLLNIQNYLDSNKWTLTHTITLRDEDSLFWGFSVRSFIDSVKATRTSKTPTKEDNFNSFLASTYDPNMPLCFFYTPHNEKTKSNLIITDLLIRLPKEMMYHSISLGLKDYWGQKFKPTIELSYRGKEMQSILQEIASLKIPKDSSYIVYEKKAIKRVYKYHDQIISLTSFDLDDSSDLERYFTIEIASKDNYLFLNSAEVYLKGKVDNIQ